MKRLLAVLALLPSLACAQQQLPSGSPGDMIYRGASAWARLPGGTGGCPLVSQGATVAATWQCDLTGSTGLKLLNQATNTVLGNNTGGTHWPIPITVSQALDTIGYDTLRPPSPGSLLVKTQNPGTWQVIPAPAAVGWTLVSQGPQQTPIWAPIPSTEPSDGDKGDITVSSSGFIWIIDPNAVSYAKIQDASAASVLLGRGSAFGAGNYEEILLGTGLTMTGTTLSSTGAVIDGNKGDITVSAGGDTWTINPEAVTYEKMQNTTQASILLGRGSSASVDSTIQEILLGTGLTMTGTTISSNGGVTPAALTAGNDTNVTLTLGGTPATSLLQATSITAGWAGSLANARLAQMAANTFKGNVTGSTASATDITFTACASDGSHALTYVNGSGFACTAISTGVTPAALTANSDTNITLTLGGTPATSLLQAASITAGFAGSLANSRLATMAANTVKGNFTGSTASPTDNTMPSCSTDGQHALTYTNGSGLNCTTLTGNAASINENIEFVIDGGGAQITTGVKGDLEVSFNCVITRARQMADQTGSIITNIWKAAFASFPPTVANKITSSTPPTITSASTSSDTTLASWSTNVTTGDILRFNVDGATTIQRVTLSLTCSR